LASSTLRAKAEDLNVRRVASSPPPLDWPRSIQKRLISRFLQGKIDCRKSAKCAASPTASRFFKPHSIAQRIEDPIEGLRELVRAYANGLIDPGGSQRRRVAVHGWAEALQNPRVHARIVEGINIPRTLIVGLVERAQRIGRLSDDLSADAVARCFVGLFQGFVLQVVWGEDLDVKSCVAALDRMLLGLANANPQPTRGR
jgi:hypothetical protein